MLSSPEPRTTQPLITGNGTPVDIISSFQVRSASISKANTKTPIVIPATTKRLRTAPLPPPPTQRRTLVLPGVLFGTLVIFVIASLFVIPLDNSQHPRSVAQTIGDLISVGRFDAINTIQQVGAPLATPALLTGEGYCGGTDIWGVCANAVIASGIISTGQMQRPIQGAVITQVFGYPEYQLWCGCWKPHSGIDLSAPYGTPILAADTGQVIWTGWDWSGLGWAVKINHGNYIATIYGHLQRFIVKVGQNVTKGQIIAYEGSTGASTGPHLHFMILFNNIWVDPANYMQLP